MGYFALVSLQSWITSHREVCGISPPSHHVSSAMPSANFRSSNRGTSYGTFRALAACSAFSNLPGFRQLHRPANLRPLFFSYFLPIRDGRNASVPSVHPAPRTMNLDLCVHPGMFPRCIPHHTRISPGQPCSRTLAMKPRQMRCCLSTVCSWSYVACARASDQCKPGSCVVIPRLAEHRGF